jgi:hypothetical protein
VSFVVNPLQYQAFDAVLEVGDVEVDQVAQADVGELEVGEQLGFVEGDHLFDGFEFEDDGVFDDDVAV